MMDQEAFLKGLSRCDIFFENEKISEECIVREAIEFFATAFFEPATRRRTLLHTGSIVYDAIAVFLAALADVLVFYVKDDEFLSNLKPGDVVINTRYGKRLRREVIEVNFGENIKLLEDPKTQCLYTMPWSFTRFLEPNRGKGRRIGGAGLRQAGSRAREEFFEYAFDVKSEDLPRAPKSYSIVVSSHDYAHRLYRGIKIEVKSRFGKRATIGLSDIAGGIYVTPEQNLTLGGALSNDDSVLRFCSSLTLAKEKINESGGNGMASLLVVAPDALMAGDAVLFNKLSSMKKKNFVLTSIPIGSPAVENAIRNVGEGGKLLSHTKHYLRKFPQMLELKQGIVGEIWAQVRSSTNTNIYTEKVNGFLSAEGYTEWRAAVKAFKNVPYEMNAKAAFLDEACGLMSFLKGSVFEMADVDNRIDLVWRGRKLSPVARLLDLSEISAKYPSEVKVLADRVVSIIKIAYNGLKTKNEKLTVLERVIADHQGQKIAVIVPQEGFKVIFEELGYCRRIRSMGGTLTVATPNSFGRGSSRGSQERYDVVVSLGGAEGRRFSPFSCSRANEIRVLLYPVEAKRFIDREKSAINREKVLNNQSSYSDYTAKIESERRSAYDEESRFETELSVFLRDFRAREDRRLAEKYGRLSGSNRNVNVVKIGTFDSGEKIFFTKFFRPYVMDGDGDELREVELDEIAIGDTLLFTQNNDASKDIVDIMLNDYIASQTSTAHMQEALTKTRRWRQLLRDYSRAECVTAVEIAERMKMFGSTVHEVTVRNWMDEESHLVGPRNKSSLGYIAKLTGDVDLCENVDAYFESCRIVRERRVKLLHELGLLIKGGMASEKFAGKNDISIAAKVKEMVKLCVLENLTDAPEDLFMNSLYVNHPIISEEKASA